VMLPILLLPIALSLLIPAVRATRGLLEGVALADLQVWFNLLIGSNVIYITLAYALFDFIVEE
jgi:heme exporter protein B